ncbi:MAG: SprT family zinc-dependent metalloprotease [Candidatus Saccharibacteria bacterium]|nr:SprT family zinc-dependent metalloprotease [Candidatus Saccharibacteria bacterium]
MPDFHDQVLGKVIVSRGRSSKYVRLGVTPAGDIKVSAPLFTPMYFIKNFVKKSRNELGQMVKQYRTNYTADSQIGKSHQLVISDTDDTSKVTYKKPNILVNINHSDDILDDDIQSDIRQSVIKALRTESKAYLPRRVEHIARTYGFQYERLRFSHAKSRWGSCSSDGTISLNIALMKLPFELIDYVIIHELVHTRYLNHSADFWELVHNCDAHYKTHRKTLKNYSPHI